MVDDYVCSTAAVYEAYHNRTSIVIPLPPTWYCRFKPWAKILLFDLPMFAYKPEMETLLKPAKSVALTPTNTMKLDVLVAT